MKFVKVGEYLDQTTTMNEQPASDPPPPLLYSMREEWKDVQPLDQSDLTNPLVPIFYPPEYKDAMDYFRGIVAKGEKSQRVLELTEHIIRMNPAHYTVWQYRYDTLLELEAPLDKELALMDELALTNMKFYQVWHHRKLLLLKYAQPAAELSFISKVLAVDSKNYHTWAYRQWLLAHFDQEDLWSLELPSVELLLQEDVRNNSAWHHRFFVVFDSGVREGDEDREQVLRREINFTKQKIAIAPNNLSAWNYLRGILDRVEVKYATLKDFVVLYTTPREERPVVEEEVLDLDNPRPSSSASLPCALAIEFLADICLEEGDTTKAAELFTSLAEEHDTMRKRYWDYRVKECLGTQSTRT